MCGRYAISSAAFRQVGPFDVREWFEDSFESRSGLSPRFNIAPSQDAPVLFGDSGMDMSLMRWGLAPAWSTDPKRGPINARGETVASQPMFQAAFKRRRCVVPASGFYEWQGSKPPKQPWYITAGDGLGLLLGGVWEEREFEGRNWRTFAIVTTSPNGVMREIHDRMPVILSGGDARRWIEGEVDEARELIGACDDDWLRAWRVSTRVNSPRHDAPDLIEPVE